MSIVGILGGTFDPVHVGHLDVARAARRALNLDRVLLMPANVPPHRASPRATAPHRFAMAALAAAFEDGLALLDLEMLSGEPSYTSATLDRLDARGLDTRRVYLITGADAFRDIATWKDYPAILERCHFAVVSRPDCAASSLRHLLPDLADRMTDGFGVRGSGFEPRTSNLVLIDAPTAPVSSTDIRRRLGAGEPITGLVPDLVADHIRKHGLYTQESTLTSLTHAKS